MGGMLVGADSGPTFLEGHVAIANAIRLFIIFIGFTLALVAGKVAARALRFQDWERGFGALAFALIVITPSISGLFRFDAPLVLPTTLSYLGGLLCGVVAAYFRFTLRWEWWNRARQRRRQRLRER